MLDTYEYLKEKFRQAECNHTATHSSNEFPHCDLKVNFIKCAILILLTRKNQQFHVVFSIRSLHLKTYSGEICYPGGKYDSNLDNNSFEQTALREAHEEIGISKQNVKIICKLCPFPTLAGHYIVPVIGLLCSDDGSSYEDTHHIIDKLKINPDEVQSVFTVPLDYFKQNLNNSKQIFNLIHETFNKNYFQNINPLKKIDDLIPNDFYRLFINLDESVFNQVNGTFPYLYGFNAFMLLLVLILIESNDSNCHLELHNDSITLNHANIIQFLQKIRICSYLLFVKERLIKSSKL